MATLIRTDSSHPDFIELVSHLDAELKIRDGDLHSFYDQYNKIDMIKYALVAFENNTPVGCGAIKQFNTTSMEVKRMFVLQRFRGKGIATQLLSELEKWAEELSFRSCILETGSNQPEAIALYEKTGYNRIKNYGQYAEIENSLCFEKTL